MASEEEEIRKGLEAEKARKLEEYKKYKKGLEQIKLLKAKKGVKYEKKRKGNTAPTHKPKNVVTYGLTPYGIGKKVELKKPLEKTITQQVDEANKKAVEQELKKHIKAEKSGKMTNAEKRSEYEQYKRDTNPHKRYYDRAKDDFDKSR